MISIFWIRIEFLAQMYGSWLCFVPTLMLGWHVSVFNFLQAIWNRSRNSNFPPNAVLHFDKLNSSYSYTHAAT